MLVSDTILQGRYSIVRPLGQGGMGAIYLAKDKRLNNLVAVKETFSSDSRLRKAFEREAQLLASLRHPALPVVSDHFIEGDGQYLVMQFIPGDDLAKSLGQRGDSFPVSDVLDWADQLLEVLDYMHTQKPPVVHRDIKPHNVKLTDRGRIILLDFGLAKGQPLQMSRVTSGGSIYGYTPSYAPFEQIRGAGTDPRSDLYSLAATLYHLMTGLTPPDALSRAASIMNSEPDPLRPAHELNLQVPPRLSDILARAMAQKREDRFSTAVEMRSALRDMAQPAATDSIDAKTIIGPLVEIVSEPPVARPSPDETTLPAFSPPKPVEVKPAPARSAETIQLDNPATNLSSISAPVALPDTNKEIDQKRSALIRWPGIVVIIVVLIAVIIGSFWLLNSNKDEAAQAGAQRTEQPIPESSTGSSIPAGPAAIYHNNLGDALRKQQKYTEAEAEYRAAIRIDPNYTEAKNNLDRLLEK
jgi:serine/threonine protein kinase